MADEKCSRCGVAITGLEPAYLINGEHVACRNCHDSTCPLCPHCGRQLTRKLPKTWSKCSECGERFWVEPQQWLYSSMILTPDQRRTAQEIVREMSRLGEWGLRTEDRKAAELKAQFDNQSAEAVIRALRVEAIRRSGWAGPPDPATLADDDIDMCVRSFDMFTHRAQVRGNYGVTLGDAVAAWLRLKPTLPRPSPGEDDEDDDVQDEFAVENRLLCELWQQALQRAPKGDLHTCKMIAFGWAESCAIAGIDFAEPLRQAARYELLDRRSHRIARVRILNGPQPCSACRKYKGKVLTLAQALETMPIPCNQCTARFDPETRSGAKGWCQCRYETVFDGE